MPNDRAAPIKDIVLNLDNLSCAGCVGRAERALAGVEGVRAARVNLARAQAVVEADPQTRLDDMTSALSRAGYPARVQVIEFTLDNLSCASCVTRAERALRDQPGVISANVNLAQGAARVEVFEGAVDAQTLSDALKGAGYPARLRAETEDQANSPQQRHDAEARALRRSFIMAGALTLPVFIAEMGGHLYPPFHAFLHDTFGMQTLWVLQFVLTSAVLAGPGRMFFARGLPALMRGAPDMNSLVALGTLAAWGFSTVATFAPSMLPAGAAAVYFEAAAVIVTLILLGRWLEARAKGRTGAAIAGLMGLQPRTARVLRGAETVEIPLAELVPGDLVDLRPGERVPADGVLSDGTGHIDESMITGEPMPVTKSPGDRLIGGTLNGASGLRMQVDKTGADTMLAQIIRLVESAQGAKLPVQALVDRVTLYFVPIVMAIALLAVTTWLLLGPDIGFALVAGVSVLIIACPCAMGLATPVSVMVGTGRAAELGVLFRKGTALQMLERTRIIAFDKTGTLTQGHPALTDLVPAPGWARSETLRLAAAVEARSEHPVAHAILDAARAEDLPLPEARDIQAVTGMGLRARADGRIVVLGTARLMEEEGVALGPVEARATELAEQGRTVFYMAVDGRIAALLAVADPPRESARATIAALHDMGLKTAMISGDGRVTADAVGRMLGIDHVLAECRPADKVAALERLQAQHGTIAFVGDGINDAPALAAADLGIAVGTGTDVALETADVVLVSGDPAAVLTAIRLSQRTMRNIRQNLFWAFGYNTALIPVAAGVLYPAFGLMLSPMLAAGAMALSSVCVLSNALRLRYVAPARVPVGQEQPGPQPGHAAARAMKRQQA